MPIPDLWIPPKIDVNNLPKIDDPEAAVRAIRLAQDYFMIPRGQHGGKPFTLASWMWLACWKLFGTLNSDGSRQYRRMFIFIPKKNAKSPFLAWLSVYFTLFDGEYEPRVLNVASTSEQAGHVYEVITHSIDKSICIGGGFQFPWIGERLKIYASAQEIRCFGPKGGKIRRMTGDRKAKQGADPNFIAIDEIGEMVGQAGFELYSTTTAHSQDARWQPLLAIATTANVFRPNDIVQSLLAESIIAESDPEEYPELLPILYYPSAAEEKAIRAGVFPSDETIKRLNPGHDEVLPFSTLKTELWNAWRSPLMSAKPDALRFRLNLWINAIFSWMPPHIWKACGGEGPVDLDEMAGRDVYVGIDLAAVEDLSSLCAIFAPKEPGDKVEFIVWSYLPEDRVKANAGLKQPEKDKDGKDIPVRRDAAQYQQWADDGFLTLTPGKVNNDALLLRDLIAFGDETYENADGKIVLKHDIKGIGYDPHLATRVVGVLREEGYANEMKAWSGQYGTWNESSCEFMKRCINEDVYHGENPLLNLCMLNLQMSTHTDGKIKPVKSQTTQRIDPAVAVLLAFMTYFWATQGDYFFARDTQT